MKSSINAWAFDPKLSAFERCELAKSVGFDAIELNLDEGEHNPLCLSMERSQVEMLGSRFSQNKCVISGVCSELHWKYSLTSGDDGERRKALEIGNKMIETAAILGAQTVVVVPGIVRAPKELRETQEYTISSLAWSRALESLYTLGEAARIYGVKVGIENVHFNRFLMSPLEIARFLSDLNHPSVGAYLDIGNANIAGIPEDWIRTLENAIIGIHVKDSLSELASLKTFRPPFTGDVDWRGVSKALADINYQGYLTVEQSFAGIESGGGLAYLCSCLKRLKQLCSEI